MLTFTSLLAAASMTGKSNAPANDAWTMLKEGNVRFVEGLTLNPHRDKSRMSEVAKSQKPFVIVVSCADSRVAPELLFDQGLGDLFVVRVAGNVVDKFSLASIEYAAEHLGAQALFVLGHERCGAVKAAVDSLAPKKPGHHDDHHGPANSIGALVAEIQPSVKTVMNWPGTLFDNAIAFNSDRSVHRIFQQSPLLSHLFEAGKLKARSGVYDLDSGRVEFRDEYKPKAKAAPVHSRKTKAGH